MQSVYIGLVSPNSTLAMLCQNAMESSDAKYEADMLIWLTNMQQK